MSARWVGTAFVSAVVGIAAVGQAAAQTRATLMPMVGLDIARVESDDETDNLSSRTGWLAGAALGIHVSPRFTIEPGVMYIFKGAKLNDQTGTEQGTIAFKYIEVPVLAQIRFPGTPNFEPFLTAGPFMGFKMGCDFKETGGDSIDCEDDDIQTKSSDYGIVAGAGVDFGPITVAVRYDYGLAKIDDSMDAAAAYNRVLSVVVGANIRLMR